MRTIAAALVTFAVAACGIDVRGIASSTDADASAGVGHDVTSSPLTDGGASFADGSVPSDASPPEDAESIYEPWKSARSAAEVAAAAHLALNSGNNARFR